jgi:hypothetical protein
VDCAHVASDAHLTDRAAAVAAGAPETRGFVREATLREDCNLAGDVSDSRVHGLPRREFRAG